jgi:NAD(P)-dependent dehydrogenase (short-subunit alcohol dehydrogenase family)
MAQRAALITGASGEIGLAIARVLGEEGYGLTLSARRPEKLEEAVQPLRDDGFEVLTVPANMTSEEDVIAIFDAHKERFGRLDALVNNAGVGFGAAVDEIQTKFLDLQLGVNLRALILGTREGVPLLKEAGAEHGKALIVNTASLAGKAGPAWLTVYGATKAAVINFTEGTQRELAKSGIQCTALAPGFVDTAMADFIRDSIDEALIQPGDIGEAIRFLLRTSPSCHVPEIVFTRPGEGYIAAG